MAKEHTEHTETTKTTGSPPPPPPPAPKPAPKKSFGERLGSLLLNVLWVVLFLFGLDALLGIFWPEVQQVVHTTAVGLIGTAAQMLLLRQGFSTFFQALFGIVAVIAFAFIVFALVGRFMKKVGEYARS